MLVIARVFMFTTIFSCCYNARILGIVPTPIYSHQTTFHPLWKTLSTRGHQVTVLTTDPINDGSLINITEINLSFVYKTWNKMMVKLKDENIKNPFLLASVFVSVSETLMNAILEHIQVQHLIKNGTQHFDLVIAEISAPAMFAFSKLFNCPLIVITSLDSSPTFYHIMGNPTHPVINPDFNLGFIGPINFSQRIKSVLYNLMHHFYHNKLLIKHDSLVARYFGTAYPPLKNIERNTSMLFVNADPVLNQIRPIIPAVISIRGKIHMDIKNEITENLQAFLKNTSEGFIYFSFGSNVEGTYLPGHICNYFLEAFQEVPYKVLWKFGKNNTFKIVQNVLISSWFPQQNILGHTNIKLFITQGGLQSIEEAIYNHVPMIGIPFYGDQFTNVKRMQSNGMGLIVDYKRIKKNTFKSTILEVIQNSSYSNNVLKMARIARDQAFTGLETAVWWTEYVIRHKGAQHLRSSILDLPDYKNFIFNVAGFILNFFQFLFDSL